MYALARNTWKFQTRDHRRTKTQKIECEALAPDTAEEILRALELLEFWVAQAHLRRTGERESSVEGSQLAAIGRRLLLDAEDRTADLEICGDQLENSRRKVVILKARAGYQAYRQMLHYYAVTNLLDYWKGHPDKDFETMVEALRGPAHRDWVNLGGQLMPAEEVDRIRSEIGSGQLQSWPQIHQRYDQLWQVYPREKQRHALGTLLTLLGQERLAREDWQAAVDETVRTQRYICDQVYLTRRKDYDDAFRRITFRNAAEMQAVLGTAEENSFVDQVRRATEAFQQLAQAALQSSSAPGKPPNSGGQ